MRDAASPCSGGSIGRVALYVMISKGTFSNRRAFDFWLLSRLSNQLEGQVLPRAEQTKAFAGTVPDSRRVGAEEEGGSGKHLVAPRAEVQRHVVALRLPAPRALPCGVSEDSEVVELRIAAVPDVPLVLLDLRQYQLVVNDAPGLPVRRPRSGRSP